MTNIIWATAAQAIMTESETNATIMASLGSHIQHGSAVGVVEPVIVGHPDWGVGRTRTNTRLECAGGRLTAPEMEIATTRRYQRVRLNIILTQMSPQLCPVAPAVVDGGVLR